MGEKIINAYSFPCWMIFTIIADFEMPVPHVEMSEDGYGVYVEPTKEAGLATMANLKKIRKAFPNPFPNVIGDALTEVHSIDDVARIVSFAERTLDIKINYVAHTLRMSKSKEGISIGRVCIPIEKFLNPYVVFMN